MQEPLRWWEATQFCFKNTHYGVVIHNNFFLQPSFTIQGSCLSLQHFEQFSFQYHRMSNIHKVLKYFKELTFLATGPGFSIVCTAMPVLLSIYYTTKIFIKRVHLKQEFKSDFQPWGVLWIIPTGFPRVIKAIADVYLRQHFCQKIQKANCVQLPLPP